MMSDDLEGLKGRSERLSGLKRRLTQEAAESTEGTRCSHDYSRSLEGELDSICIVEVVAEGLQNPRLVGHCRRGPRRRRFLLE